MLKLAVTDVKGRGGKKKLILFNSKRMQRERRKKNC